MGHCSSKHLKKTKVKESIKNVRRNTYTGSSQEKCEEHRNPTVKSTYQPRRPAPPPPNSTHDQLKTYFECVDADKSGTITAPELQSALINGNNTNFDINTINKIIKYFDTNKTGEINLIEFRSLWQYVVDWQNCFKKFDSDKSGSIDLTELEEALTTFGYNLSPTIYQLLLRRYDRTKKDAVQFDDFMQCCLVLHEVTRMFKTEDTDQDGVVTISYEKFLTIMFNSGLI